MLNDVVVFRVLAFRGETHKGLRDVYASVAMVLCERDMVVVAEQAVGARMRSIGGHR